MAKKLNLDSNLEDEVIIFFGTVIQKYKKESKRLNNDMLPVIFEYIQRNIEQPTVTVAIGILGDICSSFENSDEFFTKKATSLLISLLQNENINHEIKPLILSCLGDLSYVSGNYFQEFQNIVIPMVKSIINSISKCEQLPDQEITEWVLALKESLLENLTGLIQSNPANLSNYKFFEISSEFLWLVKSIYDIVSEDRTIKTTKLCTGLIGDCGSSYESKKKSLSKCTWVKQLIFESMFSPEQDLKFMGAWASDSVYGV